MSWPVTLGSENFRYSNADPLALIFATHDQPLMLDLVCLSTLNCWIDPNLPNYR